LTAVLDSTQPAGDYHVYPWSSVSPTNGSITWNAVRMDKVSGRVWKLNGDANTTPLSWSEIIQPK
jgi:hypothetical protein